MTSYFFVIVAISQSCQFCRLANIFIQSHEFFYLSQMFSTHIVIFIDVFLLPSQNHHAKMVLMMVMIKHQYCIAHIFFRLDKTLVKTQHQSQPNLILPEHFVLYQRPSSEEYLTILLVLVTVVIRRGKKSVVCVAQCVAALVPVHRTSTLHVDN